ncbi:fido domain-containing protein [Hypoxylon rubiginosum]|uniref:Fido domain-containing protein n=1 Tax=Hypoxylon rubiginosum TaxID=110542 RepID=A0ACC0D7W3_9PEZI|nr:fido domain-containing protein [Hypoxylon rubiginosum]
MNSQNKPLDAMSSPTNSHNPTNYFTMKQCLRDIVSERQHPIAIHAADDIYQQSSRDKDPKELFEKTANWMSNIRSTALNESQQNLFADEIHNATIRAIFGSNMIEGAGLGYEITDQLCRKTFAGEDVEGDNLHELYSLQPDLKEMPVQKIWHGRNEVVQHAKAFQHIIHAFVTEKQDLSEDLIKETHRILAEGVPISLRDGSEIPPEEYGGIYRTVIVGAGSTNFTVPKFVPAKMKEMCENLKEELSVAEEKKTIDPFSVAAKYSLEFVTIHPFQDGNGRLCRMILNAILCRYAGIIIPIGEHGEEREEYINIKKRSSETMEGHGEYAVFVLRKAFTRVRDLKKKLAGKSKEK